jgi:PEGA domain
MKSRLQIASLLFAAIFLTGCGTLFTGTTQKVQICSEPSGAKVQVEGLDRGITPLPVTLKKGSNGQTVTLSLDGYQQKVFQPQTVFNPVCILNLWGILGWGIDAATGALWKYDPTLYTITLNKSVKGDR